MASGHHSPCRLFIIAYLLASKSIQTFRGGALLTTSFKIDQGRCHLDLERKRADCKKRGFDSVPQKLSEDIEELDLSRNNITALWNTSFQRYLDLAHLDLSNNDIRWIEPAALHPLKGLTHLDLSSNYHIVLPSTGFLRWASKLSVLNLYNSQMKSLPSDILRWSRHLYSVRLHDNQFSAINISSCGTVGEVYLASNRIEQVTTETFVFACESKYLDIEDNSIQSIDPYVIASLRVGSFRFGNIFMSFEVMRNIFIGISQSSEIDTLYMRADLAVFPKDVFDPLRDISLRIFDLSFNQIEGLFPHAFTNLTRLQILDLSQNMIVSIEPNYFEGMHDLRMLVLNGNKIEHVNSCSCSWTLNLFELHLSRNMLTEIRSAAFLGLRNLTRLDLSSNERLTNVDLTASEGLTYIQYIDLSECRIIRLRLDTPMLKSLTLHNLKVDFCPLTPGKSFANSRSLVHLDISKSKLNAYKLWNATVNVSLFDGLLNLTTLDMSNNVLHAIRADIQPGIFQQLSALKELKLDFCDIKNLPPLIFFGLESLQKLSLRGNPMQHLYYNVFEVLREVTIIDLNTNLLAHLDEALFSKNSKLKELSIANNKLNRLNQTTFKPIESSLSQVDISMNPIVCNCDLKWLPDWLKVKSIQLMYAEDTVCSSSSLPSVREKPLLDFDPDELCRPNMALICLGPLTGICLVVIVVLVYHYRWPLRYKLFLLKLAAIGYKEIRDARDHNDYEFDVNIIFYDDDEEWIREHLRPALEERLPQFQRNIFGDGDLVLGMHYLDSVDYVVSHSYKTVVVLSRAAVRDRWFILKFRTAMDHVSDTQTEFVVVVFLEDIPEDEIPFLARLYLSDGRPYLHWTEDVRGHEYFWNELAKNLTINLRTNDLIPNE